MNLYLLLPLILGVFVIGSLSDSFAEIESVDVYENKLVTLIGEGYDADAGELSFKWTQIYGDPVKLSSTTIAEPTFMAPDVKNGEIKVLTFELVVTDAQGESSSDTVEIIVNSLNNPPTVDAGHDLYAIQSINAISIIPQVTDKDRDVLTYKWEQLSGQQVSLESTTKKHLTLQPVMFDYSNNDPLTFRITVDDGFGGVASDTVNVILYSSKIANSLISIEAGPMQTVTEGQTVHLAVTGHTLNEKPIRYTWIQFLGTPVQLSSSSGEHVEFTAPYVGDFEQIMSFHVTGYSQGNGYANDMAIVKVIPSNHAPIADAGLDRNVPQRTFVGFEGSATDADNDNIRYLWSQKSGIPIEIYEKTQPGAYIFTPTTSSLSEPLVFELKVTDSKGNSDTDDVKITVTTLNSPPRAYAGPDQRVHGGDNVSITGTAIDLNSESLKTQWKQIFGESVSFDKSSLKFSFTAPEVGPTVSKRLAFELTVTDPQGLSDSDQVVVFVTPENSAPKANAGADITVDENSIANISCIGTDPDNNRLDYTWSTTSKAVIEQTTNSKTMVQIPNVARDTTMTFTCSVTDRTYSASDSMNILVKNTFSADLVSNAGIDRIVNENIKVSLDGSKSHDPESQQLYFQWTQLSGEKVKLSSASSVTPSFTSPIVNNGEIKVLTFELKIYDDFDRESTDTVVITVDPVNSPPEASASAKQ